MIEDSNDHRNIGKRLDLFHFREEAPGMVFWHPKGLVLYRALEDAVRRQCAAQGYDEVRTPQIMRRAVWEASGHWRHFRQGMFCLDAPPGDAAEAAVKPVSCPGHVYIATHGLLSYRDLPLRLSELGVVHRDEPSGTLHGLLRVRQFTQDDGHVFCAEDQAEEEIARFVASVFPFYRAFGFEHVGVAFSSRPADRAGDDASWDRAEGMLRAVLERMNVAYVHQPGAGAFYGPKLELVLSDRHGREWQCGTIQIDMVMPERFDVRYVDARGERRRPIMLHRALYGSLERFLGMLLEHYGAELPAWLAPVQLAVLPVSPAETDAARSLVDRARARSIRAVLRADESLARRVAEAHEGAVPFVGVVGSREVEGGAVALRARGGQRVVAIDAALDELAERCAPPAFA